MNPRILIFSLLIGAWGSLSVLPIHGQTKRTVSSVVAEIESRNLSLRSQEAENNAEIMEMKSENVVGPTSIEYSPFFQSGVTGLASSELIVKQEFDFPTQYASRSKAASLRRKALDAEMHSKRRELRIQASQACIDYISASEKADILGKRLATADSLVMLYQRLYKERSATALELNQVRLSRQEIGKSLCEALMGANEASAVLTGLNGGEGLQLDGLEYDTPIDGIPLPAEAKDYASASPEVASAMADIRFSVQEMRQARASWLPTIGIGYRRNTELSEASNGFVIGLDFPLFSTGKRTAAARARKEGAEYKLEEAERNARNEAEATLGQLIFMRLTLDSYNPSLLQETIGLYAESLALRKITLTDYLRETDIIYDRLLALTEMEQAYRRLAATLQP